MIRGKAELVAQVWVSAWVSDGLIPIRIGGESGVLAAGG